MTRRLRDQRRLSLRELAKHAHVDAGHLSRVENGKRPPTPELAEALDQALGAGGELSHAEQNQQGPHAGGTTGGLDVDQEERLIAAANAPARTDIGTVDSLVDLLAAERRREDTLGSGSLIVPVRARLAMLAPWVLDARGPVRPRLVSVAAQWAQFAGWLHAATRQPTDANAWLDRATEWAQEAGDIDLMACALSFKGHVAWQTGHVGPMIGLSRAAQRNRNVYAGQRAFDCQQEARGHAMAGEVATAEAKLDEADGLLAKAAERPEDQPPWMYYQNPAFQDLQRGLVYRILGRTSPDHNRRATELLSVGLAGLPAQMRRAEWTVDYLYHRGVAYAQGRDPEAAAADVVEILSVATDTRSDAARSKASQLHALVARMWPDAPVVATIGAAIHDQ